MSVIFHIDWKKFPRAQPDYTTKNESFKRMVSLYHSMGIKNCLFPLLLLQPELQGVDPHSPDLTDEQKLLIGLECKYNPWYFLREVVRIPPVAGPVPVSYRANRGNMALTWCFLASIDIALIQPRQTGKSVSTDCLMVWLIFIALDNSTINMITKDHTLRTANVERLKKIRDLIPPYLFVKRKDDSDNQHELTCRALGNVYGTGVAQNSESAANNLGRGLTSPNAHVDEGPFIKYIDITLPAALAAGSAAREEAARNGRPNGNIFTTTAGKKDDRSGKFMYDWITNGATWDESYFDCKNRDDLIDRITKNKSGRKIIINATFSHRQLGYTDEWLMKTIAEVGATGEAADRDFFNVWTSGTQSSPLSTKLNDTIRESEIEVKHNYISKDNYIIRWYIPEDEIEDYMENSYFALGLDTSEAIGRDSIGGLIIDLRDLSTVAAFTCNETNLIRFSNFLADILIRYRNVTLIPERKSTGQMIVDNLLLTLPRYDIDPFKRIYNTIVDKHNERKDEYKWICQGMATRGYDFYDKLKKNFGFTTTGDTRNLLYSTVLQNAAKNAGHLVRDKTLSMEIRGLIVKNGRIDHESSGHDDMVIAWLLGHWFVTLTKNLSHYGIDTSKILTAVSTKGKQLSDVDILEKERAKRIKDEIEVTFDLMVNETSSIIILQLENKLKTLYSRLPEEDSEALSLDDLIHRVNEERLAKGIRANRSQQMGLDRRINWR
jgi:hypothetical protein